MKHIQYAIASIVDASTGIGLVRGDGKTVYAAGITRAHELRSRSVHDFLSAVGARIRRAVADYRERARYRRALEELSNLNDHYLDDIGLTRGDIAAVKLGQTSLEVLNSDRRARVGATPLDFVDSSRVVAASRDTEALNQAEYDEAKSA